MMIDPSEYTPAERALVDKAKDLIERYELDYGNSECFIQRDNGTDFLYATLEAPNHGTVTATLPADSNTRDLRCAMAEACADFDAEEEFNELWSPEFSQHNNLSPIQFIHNLNDDQEYFGSQYLALLHPEQSNETIALIRWTEEDLRQWLKNNDWPVTEENMDSMRDMIPGRTLQDRSIEKGREIIDAMVDQDRLSHEKEPEDDGEEASASYDPTNPADPLHETDPDSKAIRF